MRPLGSLALPFVDSPAPIYQIVHSPPSKHNDRTSCFTVSPGGLVGFLLIVYEGPKSIQGPAFAHYFDGLLGNNGKSIGIQDGGASPPKSIQRLDAGMTFMVVALEHITDLSPENSVDSRPPQRHFIERNRPK